MTTRRAGASRLPYGGWGRCARMTKRPNIPKNMKKVLIAMTFAAMAAGCGSDKMPVAQLPEIDTSNPLLAEWDTMVSKMFAGQVMKHIRACDTGNLPKKSLLAF